MTMDNPEMEGNQPGADQAAGESAASGAAPVAREGRREGSDDRGGSREQGGGGRRDREGGEGGRSFEGRGGPRGGGGSRGGGGFRRDNAESGPGGRRKRFTRRKLCPLCTAKVKVLDYKDVTRMKQFITERGKIRPRRMTGMCAKHQRQVTVAIKRARNLALMPFKM